MKEMVVCCACGASDLAENMHMEDYRDTGDGIAHFCGTCQEDTKQRAASLYPKIRTMIDNALLRETIKFDL